MRKETILQAASRRAAILGILTAAQEPVPAYSIFQNPKIKDLNFSWVSFQAFLSSMKKIKLIDTKEIEDPKAKVGYFLLNSKVANKKKQDVETQVKRPYVKTNITKPDLRIDIIKKTGRVRFELDGLFIEVGVI